MSYIVMLILIQHLGNKKRLCFNSDEFVCIMSTRGHCAGWFCVNSKQTRVIVEGGTSINKMPHQTGLWASLWYIFSIAQLPCKNSERLLHKGGRLQWRPQNAGNAMTMEYLPTQAAGTKWNLQERSHMCCWGQSWRGGLANVVTGA